MQSSFATTMFDHALRALRRSWQREGVYREMKLRRHYEKPSEKRALRARRRDPPGPQARAQADGARRHQIGRAGRLGFTNGRRYTPPFLVAGYSMSVTAVPLRPIKKGSVTRLWIGLGALGLAAAGLAWVGTGAAMCRGPRLPQLHAVEEVL